MSKLTKMLSSKDDRRPLRKRLPKRTYDAIIKDIREVAKVAKSGESIPAISRLQEYFEEEYDVHMSRDTVYRLLKGAK